MQSNLRSLYQGFRTLLGKCTEQLFPLPYPARLLTPLAAPSQVAHSVAGWATAFPHSAIAFSRSLPNTADTRSFLVVCTINMLQNRSLHHLRMFSRTRFSMTDTKVARMEVEGKRASWKMYPLLGPAHSFSSCTYLPYLDGRSSTSQTILYHRASSSQQPILPMYSMRSIARSIIGLRPQPIQYRP